MSCPNCGNMVLYYLGDDPAGTIRCGKCGNVFPEAESKDLEFKNRILEELKKINERLNELEKKAPDVNYGVGGCPNCGCKELKKDESTGGEYLRCENCGYRFFGADGIGVWAFQNRNI